MSLTQAIRHGKEFRKPYYKSQRFDATCRPGGSCPWCIGNRRANATRRGLSADIAEQSADIGIVTTIDGRPLVFDGHLPDEIELFAGIER